MTLVTRSRRSVVIILLAALSLAPVAVLPLPAHAQTPTDHVQVFGGVPNAGSLDSLRTAGISVSDATPIALVPTPSGGGYWIVLSDGNVYSFGDAVFAGSMQGLRDAGIPIDPAVVIVAAAATPTGRGYWFADDRGGVYAFGDAGFFGSMPGLQTAGLVGPVGIVGMHATPSGLGYWLVDPGGGVYAFGDAGFFGSVPGLRAAGLVNGAVRIVAIDSTPNGHGYWLTDDRGGVYAFGGAGFFGSAAPEPISEPVVGFAATASGDGYRILTADGRVRSFGAAPDHGSAAIGLDDEALGLSAAPTGTGYWVLTPQDRQATGAPPLPPNSGSGRRIVYSNSRQRVWLVEASGVVSHSWPVSGRRGVPAPGNYHIFSKSPSSGAGSLRLAHMARFAHGKRLAIGFHAIPTSNGRPIQGLDELGQYRSHGCVRQNPKDAATLYAWAPVGTPVTVTP